MPKISYDDWKPKELTNHDDIAGCIVNKLDSENLCILQGPPGTGKSYTIATIVSRYIEEGKTVCVTTMSNKGLTELIEKEPLNKAREEGKKITEEKKRKAEEIYDEIVLEAKNEANTIIERAKVEINREREKVEYQLKKEAIDLALELSTKVIEKNIDKEKNKELIDEFITEVGN